MPCHLGERDCAAGAQEGQGSSPGKSVLSSAHSCVTSAHHFTSLVKGQQGWES
jgi:hypothetical protein